MAWHSPVEVPATAPLITANIPVVIGGVRRPSLNGGSLQLIDGEMEVGRAPHYSTRSHVCSTYHLHTFRSVPHNDAANTFSNTSPALGAGTGTSTRSNPAACAPRSLSTRTRSTCTPRQTHWFELSDSHHGRRHVMTASAISTSTDASAGAASHYSSRVALNFKSVPAACGESLTEMCWRPGRKRSASNHHQFLWTKPISPHHTRPTHTSTTHASHKLERRLSCDLCINTSPPPHTCDRSEVGKHNGSCCGVNARHSRTSSIIRRRGAGVWWWWTRNSAT